MPVIGILFAFATILLMGCPAAPPTPDVDIPVITVDSARIKVLEDSITVLLARGSECPKCEESPTAETAEPMECYIYEQPYERFCLFDMGEM